MRALRPHKRTCRMHICVTFWGVEEAAWQSARLLGCGGGGCMAKMVQAEPSGMSATSSPSQAPLIVGLARRAPSRSTWPTICRHTRMRRHGGPLANPLIEM